MSPRAQLILALVLLGIAVALAVRFLRAGDGISDLAFFYDESAQKIFKAPRTSVPPIRGTDGPEEDAFRAVVISTTGKPTDKNSWQIAYLEKYSPELKRQMETAQTGGASPSMGRADAQEHRFVRRPREATWYPMSAPEAEAILTGWATPGPAGVTPVICTP